MDKKINGTLHSYMVFGILLILLMCVYLINYVDLAYPKKYTPDIPIENNPSDFSYAIDNVDLSNGIFTIRGWALVKGQRLSGSVSEASYWDVSIIAYSKNDDQYTKIMTQFQLRNDVTQEFKDASDYKDNKGDPVDYSASGFISSGKLSGELMDYEFYILYRHNNVNRLIKIEV